MLAELTALWGFAFVQPVLDVFGRSPEQFVFRRADATTVVVFALGLTVVPIAALWLIEQLGAVAHRVVGQVLAGAPSPGRVLRMAGQSQGCDRPA